MEGLVVILSGCQAITSPDGLAPKNPVGLLNLRNDESDVKRFISNIQLDYKFHFLPDLRANLNVGIDYSKGEGTIFIPDSADSLIVVVLQTEAVLKPAG